MYATLFSKYNYEIISTVYPSREKYGGGVHGWWRVYCPWRSPQFAGCNAVRGTKKKLQTNHKLQFAGHTWYTSSLFLLLNKMHLQKLNLNFPVWYIRKMNIFLEYKSKQPSKKEIIIISNDKIEIYNVLVLYRTGAPITGWSIF